MTNARDKDTSVAEMRGWRNNPGRGEIPMDRFVAEHLMTSHIKNTGGVEDKCGVFEHTEMKCSEPVCSVHTHLPTGSQGIQLHREGV